MDYKHTCDTIFAHFQGITNNIYGFGRPFFAPSFFLPVHHISTRPYSFLPVIMTGGLVSTLSYGGCKLVLCLGGECQCFRHFPSSPLSSTCLQANSCSICCT